MFAIPDRYKWARLDAPELATRIRNRLAREAAALAVDARRVVLCGEVDSGKTSLAVAIGQSSMQARDVCGMFALSLELDHARRESALGRGDAELIQAALRVPVLVIDELGAECGDSGAVAEIIHKRHESKHKQTIVTVALSTEGMRKVYSGGILKRIYQGAVVIQCDRERQPVAKSAVERLPPRRPFAAPPPRAPVILEPVGPAELAAVMARIGAPVVDEAAIAERHALLREQAAQLRADEAPGPNLEAAGA